MSKLESIVHGLLGNGRVQHHEAQHEGVPGAKY